MGLAVWWRLGARTSTGWGRKGSSAATYDVSVWESQKVPGGDVRPPWWRTFLLMIPSAFLSVSSAVFSRIAEQIPADGSGAIFSVLVGMTALLLAVLLPIGLAWRHRYPFALVFVAAGVSLVLPIGSTVSLVALATLIGRRRGTLVWVAGGVVALTTTWTAIFDALAQPRQASALKMIFGPAGADPAEPATIEPYAVAVIILVGLGMAVGAGLLTRARREAAAANRQVLVERQTSDRLGDEVARRQERERIAREVHDAMGHRLSLLSLHAGALEANAAGDARLEESARLVRQSASDAVQDLSSLLAVLRQPLGDEPHATSLANLQDVVRDSVRAGERISSAIFVEHAERADPALARAVYRIVQELLTNARKHASGQQVVLSVVGSPAAGITIDARNPYLNAAQTPSGGSRGLSGIAERTELLGGRMRYGLDEGNTTFHVTVELPWRFA